jgi:hypothetical protein
MPSSRERFMTSLISCTWPLKIEVGDQGRIEQHLDRRHPPLAVLLRQQALRDQRTQIEGKVHQQLVAALFGEEVDDPVDRLVGAVGMQRGQAQVSGFGKGDGVVHGLPIPDFAHHDHVRCLPQGVLQRDFPGVGVDADLALGDDAFLVLMHELDRVFDGDDVTLAIAVAVIDQRGQRGGFAGAGAADKNDQAAQVIAMSLSTAGKASSSRVGTTRLIVRQTTATRPCCTSALTRKRPMPGGEMAKLHSLLSSNSEA